MQCCHALTLALARLSCKFYCKFYCSCDRSFRGCSWSIWLRLHAQLCWAQLLRPSWPQWSSCYYTRLPPHPSPTCPPPLPHPVPYSCNWQAKHMLTTWRDLDYLLIAGLWECGAVRWCNFKSRYHNATISSCQCRCTLCLGCRYVTSVLFHFMSAHDRDSGWMLTEWLLTEGMTGKQGKTREGRNTVDMAPRWFGIRLRLLGSQTMGDAA